MIRIGEKIYGKDPDFYKKFNEVALRLDTDTGPWEEDENGPYFVVRDSGWTQANEIRGRREVECFPIINRGPLWYDLLTTVQKAELSDWYRAWLDAPATGVIPNKPSWLEEVLT